MPLPEPRDLANRLLAGERRALARAITLVESTRPDHRVLALELLDLLCVPTVPAKIVPTQADDSPGTQAPNKNDLCDTVSPQETEPIVSPQETEPIVSPQETEPIVSPQETEPIVSPQETETTAPEVTRRRAKRIGVSGTPGVGKSTLIEALGLHLVRNGSRLAVLAVDPSSVRTGGSIMGDKTRMTELSRSEGAFIRPSASQGVLGGVANRTGEVVGLVEAAGYDTVIVETVGVGQSEVAVASITDLFILLVAPAGGDDLQGIKRGVMELVDAVFVNKADGDLVRLANHTAADYQHALSFLRPKTVGQIPPVLTCSALTNTGIEAAWSTVADLWANLDELGYITDLRAKQASAALHQEIREILSRQLLHNTDLTLHLQTLDSQVQNNEIAPASAAAQLTDLLLRPNSD